MKLEPCPFCGEEKQLKVKKDYITIRTVECLRCGCEGPIAHYTDKAITNDIAIDLWNKRTPGDEAVKKFAEDWLELSGKIEKLKTELNSLAVRKEMMR